MVLHNIMTAQIMLPIEYKEMHLTKVENNNNNTEIDKERARYIAEIHPPPLPPMLQP